MRYTGEGDGPEISLNGALDSEIPCSLYKT
jgi:hypothetical protein